MRKPNSTHMWEHIYFHTLKGKEISLTSLYEGKLTFFCTFILRLVVNFEKNESIVVQ